MATLDTLTNRALALIQDDTEQLDEAGADEAIRQALALYSRHAPARLIEDIEGDGAAWSFDLPAGFSPAVSVVTSVEYPVGSRPPSYLAAHQYAVYHEPDGGAKLQLPAITPAAGTTLRVTYTGAHTIEGLDGAEATSIPDHHLAGFVALTAAIMLREAAHRFVHEMEAPLFSGDAKERGDKAKSAAARADELMAFYEQMVAIAEGKVGPAMAVIDWDTSFGGTGIEHLTHPSRWR